MFTLHGKTLSDALPTQKKRIYIYIFFFLHILDQHNFLKYEICGA